MANARPSQFLIHCTNMSYYLNSTCFLFLLWGANAGYRDHLSSLMAVAKDNAFTSHDYMGLSLARKPSCDSKTY